MFFLSRRFGDTRVLHLTRALPTPARLPLWSPRQQPLSGLNTAHVEVRHASFGFRDRLLPHARRLRRIPAPPPPTRTSSKTKIERARTPLRFLLTVRSPTSAVLARARGGHHPRRRVHQAGHGVRRRPARHRRAAQGTSIRRRRADPRPPRARRTTRENVRGVRTESENDDSPPPLWRLAEDFFSNEALFGALVFSVEEEETHRILVPLTTAATAADQGIGRFRCALAHAPVIARSTPRLQPPDRPRSAVASLSEPRRRGSFRANVRRFSLVAFGRSRRSVDPSKPIQRRAEEVTDDDFAS